MVTLDKYIKVGNKDGKIWILPTADLSMAFNLYQPSAVKGRILKRWLPILYPIPFISNVLEKLLNIEPCCYEIKEELASSIEKAFTEEISSLSLALFLGTPSVHRKMTIQISKQKTILGYCKYTEDEQIKEIFMREKFILDKLNNAGVDGVPRCLFCGEIADNCWAFIQSTKKTRNSVITHTLSEKHVSFLRDLYEKTKIECQYSNTEYHRLIKKFSSQLMKDEFFSIQEKEKYISAVGKTDGYYSGQYEFCAFQADFTPWNMFEENEKLFVFDWEYAKLLFPPFLDLFHFFTQSEIFEYQKDADEIICDFKREFSKPLYFGLFRDKEIAYLSYLVYIVGFYLERDKGNFSKDTKHCIATWMQIMTYLL